MRIYNEIKHALERFIVRGASFQLMLVAALIGAISVLGGTLIAIGVEGSGNIGESTWWAFLRLTDPGYLGDDTGTFKRVVSTIITVLGYVLFMGSLVAILTQWLNATIKKLEMGLTPVARNNHLLILGWTERAAIVVRDLFLSEGRVRRFLRRRGARKLHMVVLAEDAGAAMRADLRIRVGQVWKSSKVTLRSGSTLRSDHLSRVDFLHASSVILPAGDFAQFGPEAVDTHTIKALLSMSNHPAVSDPNQLPLAVAEVLDARKVPIAEAAYAGPLEVIPSDAVVSRLIAQNIRHRGLSNVYTELLTHREGNEIFIRDLPALHGTKVTALFPAFPAAIPIGVVRKEQGHLAALLNPADELVIQSGDRLVLIAREYEDTEPSSSARPADGEEVVPRSQVPVPSRQPPQNRRILVLGWSHKVPPLLMELSLNSGAALHVDVASAVPSSDRVEAISKYMADLGGIEICHHNLDYTMPAELAKLSVGNYDTILLLGSDWLRSGEESDARTIVGYLTLQRALAECSSRPHIIVEILDPMNVGLLGKRPGEVLISPVILSHMLAQVSLRRELNVVFEDLFSIGGTEITFKSPAEYDYVNVEQTFARFQKEATRRGEIALGILIKGGSGKPHLKLNPPREMAFTLSPEDELVVLSDR